METAAKREAFTFVINVGNFFVGTASACWANVKNAAPECREANLALILRKIFKPVKLHLSPERATMRWWRRAELKKRMRHASPQVRKMLEDKLRGIPVDEKALDAALAEETHHESILKRLWHRAKRPATVGLGILTLSGPPLHAQDYQIDGLIKFGRGLEHSEYVRRLDEELINIIPGPRDDAYRLIVDRMANRVANSSGYFAQGNASPYFEQLKTFRAIEPLLEEIPQEAYRATIRDYFLRNITTITPESARNYVDSLPKNWQATPISASDIQVDDVLRREYGQWYDELNSVNRERLLRVVVDGNPIAGYGTHLEGGREIPLERRYWVGQTSYTGRSYPTLLIPPEPEAKTIINTGFQVVAQNDGPQ